MVGVHLARNLEFWPLCKSLVSPQPSPQYVVVQEKNDIFGIPSASTAVFCLYTRSFYQLTVKFQNCGDHTLLQQARTGTKLHFTHGQWTASATASVNLTTHARTSRLWPLTRRKLMRVIVVYDDHALVDRTCQKWFARCKQTQKELAKTLGVTQPAILLRLKEIGMIRGVGNWVPCELKPRDVECRFSREKLLQRPKKK
ncbi:hypothetical protein LAZ67_12003602 [Cordylochernes scorpioides]|uniref:Mariner Mos1 transposase n=1 Tax=Cordylochernes scorpioides TaxID=51811 RepID=A0ABY6L2I9_9ARAC|nr:hypothetical protein LAZ67_12003602 [Cordylochernes scorpioides]